MNIGYVGLGNMGAALAARLQLEHPLRVFDLDPAAVRRLVEKGATACSSLQELASSCDVILLCLPTSDHVRRAIFAEDGLAQGLTSAKLIIDQSSGDPSATRAMAADLAAPGIDLVDAPVAAVPTVLRPG
ncbi:MAG: NAD(P)-binding domain-containing protein, partial [Burkholderiaceae bacterium]|nr:NAD(P)-binding domain-containing protein [Burkholderiaceae bacterium]